MVKDGRKQFTFTLRSLWAAIKRDWRRSDSSWSTLSIAGPQLAFHQRGGGERMTDVPGVKYEERFWEV